MTEVEIAERFESMDVFAAFEQMAGSGSDIDPYPILAELRREGPVTQVDIHERLGIEPDGNIGPVTYRHLDAPVFSALSFDAVSQALRDAAAFPAELQRQAQFAIMGKVLNGIDPPEHRRTRLLVEEAFTRRSMEVWDETIIWPLIEQYLDQFEESTGPVDLVSEMMLLYPARVITGLLGLPNAEMDRFMHLATAMFLGNEPELAVWAAGKINAWVDEIVAEREAAPEGDDVIALLLRARAEGERLSNEEIAAFIRLLYPAGFETTSRALSNLLFGILTTDQWGLLCEKPELIPQAVQEGLRWEAPIVMHPRLAAQDTEVCGVAVPAGAVMLAFQGSGNRDETRWDDPDRFDVTRPIKANTSFGFGVHHCIGRRLAEIEMAQAVLGLTQRFPDLHLDPDASPDDVQIRGIFMRSPRTLPVVLHR